MSEKNVDLDKQHQHKQDRRNEKKIYVFRVTQIHLNLIVKVRILSGFL